MVLEVKNIVYYYKTNKSKNVLNGISYKFEEGKVYAILGASGSGKTTFLSLLAGLDVPVLGITRLLSMNDPKKVVYADFQYPYSEKEWEVFSMLTLDKGYNSTVMAEMKNLEKSMEAVENMKIPKEIPILQFVSKENCRTMPQWEQLHRDIIADKENGEVILLEGSHYLHFEQRLAIVQKTIQWIENR